MATATQKKTEKTGRQATSPRSTDPIGAKIDGFVRDVMNANHIPGISLLVLRDGKVIKQTCYGLANVEHKV